MKTLFSLFVLLNIASVNFGQEAKTVLHPTKNEPLNEGIYMTFAEWEANTPSSLYTLNIDKTKNVERASLHERLQGIPVKETASGSETFLKAHKVFAYFDGIGAYISFGTSYFEITEIGTFCLFTTNTGASASSYGSASSNPIDYFLNMKTGKSVKLTGGTLSSIVLADYPDLQAKFKAEKMKAMMLNWYLNEANGRYRK
jgi:hypothetical protein